MAGFIVFHYNITDRSRIDELTRLSIPVNEMYDVEVLVGSPVKALEGEALTHMVILKFDSFEKAEEFYDSPEQKKLARLRSDITEGWVTIVPGDSETQKVVESGISQCHENMWARTDTLCCVYVWESGVVCLQWRENVSNGPIVR